mmetsp:Transcript_9382/g.27037  ORF Transcript_9382/g.27037 Transcript_9382/m.27037 type:complete len:81 (-) Transcript_9382:895-1137(-)
MNVLTISGKTAVVRNAIGDTNGRTHQITCISSSQPEICTSLCLSHCLSLCLSLCLSVVTSHHITPHHLTHQTTKRIRLID